MHVFPASMKKESVETLETHVKHLNYREREKQKQFHLSRRRSPSDLK